jgi:hypothetical protein
MTVKEMLASAREELGEIGRLRYGSGTADSDGATDGTTLIDSAFAGVADGWNNAQVRITSGDALGERRDVADFASGTITVTEPFSVRILDGVTFEVGERGYITDHALIDFFTQAQDRLIYLLPASAFPGHLDTLEVSAASGVSSALPANLAGAPSTVRFKSVAGIEYDAVILPASEHDRFREDTWLGSSLDDLVAIFDNGVIKYKPSSTSGTFLLPVVPKFDAVTFADGSPFPTYLHHILVEWAIYKGWRTRQQPQLAAMAKQDFVDSVNAINQKYGNKVKLDIPEE